MDPVTSVVPDITHDLQSSAAMQVIATTAADSLLSLTNNFISATVNSLFLILVTEIGDKTFFIAAVLAMRHARLVVYAGAMGETYFYLFFTPINSSF
jgi:hypothetical protein